MRTNEKSGLYLEVGALTKDKALWVAYEIIRVHNGAEERLLFTKQRERERKEERKIKNTEKESTMHKEKTIITSGNFAELPTGVTPRASRSKIRPPQSRILPV